MPSRPSGIVAIGVITGSGISGDKWLHSLVSRHPEDVRGGLMAAGRSRAERERLFQEGRCMGTRCRQYVKNGDGSQFLEPDGSFSRLCLHCGSLRMGGGDTPQAAAAMADGIVA